MGYMSFLDTIPTCGSADWDQWDMQDLINETNTNHPDRITPTMESALLELERQLSMLYLIWGAIQRTLFQSLVSSVGNQAVFHSINSFEDFVCFSRAFKKFRDRYDLYLASGQNLTLLEERYKNQIRKALVEQNLNTNGFDKFQETVAEVKRAVLHTPLALQVTYRFIADIVLTSFKGSNLALSTIGFQLSSDPRRYDLTYLFN
jgi:hypothetical protein